MTSSSNLEPINSTSAAFPYTNLLGLTEEADLRSFISPYRHQPYCQCIPASSFAQSNVSPKPLYDIIRDPSVREIDHYIAEVNYSLVHCYRGIDAEDRVADMKIGVTLPVYMKLCIEYIDNFRRVTDRNVS
jgi:hypothetical protein